MRFSDIQPRHVLCILGPDQGYAELARSIQSGIDDFAPEFEIDTDYSLDTPDARMEVGFDVCWDRVHEEAWTDADEAAVEDHGCVIYVLGPRMEPDNSVAVSAQALRLIAHVLAGPAVAVKGETAGVAHGVERWQQLCGEAEHARSDAELARVCRLALCKRPLGDDEFLSSVGFHLVGLPEVFVPREMSDDELVLSAKIDSIADQLFAQGVEPVLRSGQAALEPVDGYDEDAFKYNPYGALYWHVTDTPATRPPEPTAKPGWAERLGRSLAARLKG